MDLVTLSDLLADYFSLDELADLCLRLAIDFEDIPGATRSARARELVDHCRRHGRLDALIGRCRELRPHVDWPAQVTTPAAPPVTSEPAPAALTGQVGQVPGTLPAANVPQLPGMFWMPYPDTWYGPFNGFYIGWLSVGGFQVWNPMWGAVPYPDPFRQFQRNTWVRLINSPFNVFIDGGPSGHVFAQFSP